MSVPKVEEPSSSAISDGEGDIMRFFARASTAAHSKPPAATTPQVYLTPITTPHAHNALRRDTQTSISLCYCIYSKSLIPHAASASSVCCPRRCHTGALHAPPCTTRAAHRSTKRTHVATSSASSLPTSHGQCLPLHVHGRCATARTRSPSRCTSPGSLSASGTTLMPFMSVCLT